MTALDGSRVTGFLSADSKIQMMSNANLPSDFPAGGLLAGRWLGLGIYVGPTAETYGHGGVAQGSVAILLREARGYTFAVTTNGRNANPLVLETDMLDVMTQALDAGLAGSATDLYPQYVSPSLPARTP
jgi:hypothetical protein